MDPRSIVLSATLVLGCTNVVEPSYKKMADGERKLVGFDEATSQFQTSPIEILNVPLFIPAGLSGSRIFFEADGNFSPTYDARFPHEGIAKVWVQVDGPVTMPVTNESMIDWRHSTAPMQHAFNLIGAPPLPAGLYAVRLMAEPLHVVEDNAMYPFYVRNASLAVMRPRLTQIEEKTLANDSTPSNFPLTGSLPPDPTLSNDVILDHLPLEGMSHQGDFIEGEPWIVLASGNSWIPDSTRFGDAMWGLFADWYHCGDKYSTWTVNDVQEKSEPIAPMFLQGYFDTMPCRTSVSPERTDHPFKTTGPFTVRLDATKFPFPNVPPWNGYNPILYSVKSGAHMVFLSGKKGVQGSSYDYNANLTNDALEGIILTVGSPMVLTSTTVSIPRDHNGVVFFTAKSRNMGVDASEHNNETGAFSLWIEIRDTGDNACSATVAPLRFSPHTQQAAVNDSQRTLSASLLTAGPDRLQASRTFYVNVCSQVSTAIVSDTQDIRYPVMTVDMPLVWFDGDGSP